MADEDEVVIPKIKKTKKVNQNVLITIIVFLNTLIIGAIGYYQYQGFQKFKTEETVKDLITLELKKRGVIVEGESETGEAQIDEGKLFPLERFTANLAPSEGAKKYVRINLVLKFSRDSNDREFKLRKPQIIDSIITILNSKKAEELLNKEGKEFLKEELKAAINAFLAEARIVDIFFVGFQIN
ncbi:MAG: hypothetical protein DRQ88_05600 [Epsilonproteobacteria bacterium]|nr:MAG: hypothetical protein DRQ89_07165 [Campylobacterota bacterium]RLA66687.1 MAG: hypothetical protein DRQ88_05600 [Campylobacterota bacterium]